MDRTCRKQKPSASQKLHFQFHVYQDTETADFGTIISVIQISRSLATQQIKGHEDRGEVTSNVLGMAPQLSTHPLLRVPKIPRKTQKETIPQGELLGMGVYREFSGCSVPQGLLNTLGSATQADHQLILQGEYLCTFGTMCIPNNDVSDAETSTPICPTSPTSPEPPSPLARVYLLSKMSPALSVNGVFFFP